MDFPTSGFISIEGNLVTYSPNPDFNGNDSFTFTANDGVYNSNIATIYLTISPVNDGNWESKISISGIMKLALERVGREIDPERLCQMAINKDKNAILVWNEFGYNLGLALSHFINMLDPNIISIGGGISAAFNLFETDMIKALNQFSPSYKKFNINIFESRKKELSSQLGAALLVKIKQK